MSFSPLSDFSLHIRSSSFPAPVHALQAQSTQAVPHRLLSLPVSGWLMAVLWRFPPLLGK